VELLALARSLGAIVGAGPDRSLTAALALLEQAFAPGASLPRRLAQAWLRTAGDKTAALALGWAREQVRHALAEALPPEGEMGEPAEVAAWLLLAAAEAEAREPGGTVGDRLRMVCDLLGLPARR
jgi:hypothetical protein